LNVAIGLFKRLYTVRKHGAQTITCGYASAPYTDVRTMLNVQPLSPDELQALPEGERTVKRVKTYGAGKLTSADEYDGVPADMLFYRGQWYKCKSSVDWNHTMLSHYRSEFVILPECDQPDPPEVTP